MSRAYLYCQNPECGEYLGSLGGESCGLCGWVSPPENEQDAEALDGAEEGQA